MKINRTFMDCILGHSVFFDQEFLHKLAVEVFEFFINLDSKIVHILRAIILLMYYIKPKSLIICSGTKGIGSL